MNANVGGIGRVLRILVGIALIVWALMGGPVWAWVGVVPLATGLLVVLVGKASRLSPFLLGLDKSYLATVRFGTATDSLDADGAGRAAPRSST